MCWVAEERMHLAKRMIGKVETAEIIETEITERSGYLIVVCQITNV